MSIKFADASGWYDSSGPECKRTGGAADRPVCTEQT